MHIEKLFKINIRVCLPKPTRYHPDPGQKQLLALKHPNSKLVTQKSHRKQRRMQKREFNKSGGSYGGASAPPAKRGRPFGSGNSSAAAAAAAAAAADHTAAPSNLLGPSLLVHNAFTGQYLKSSVNLSLQFLQFFSFIRNLCSNFKS